MSTLFRPDRTETYQRIEAILERAEPHLEYPCPKGTVHRAWFVHGIYWGQAGARISEMNDLGWSIASVTLPESQWRKGIRTAYRLDSKPLQAGQDWYRVATGRERPSVHPWKQPFSERRMAEDFQLTPPEPRQ